MYTANVEILEFISDLFGKAKKKILKQDDISETFPSAIPQDKRKSPEINWGAQEIGIARYLRVKADTIFDNIFLIKVLK